MKDTYWTIGKGTRNETRVRRCGRCGNTTPYRPGSRPGPCPFKAMHERAPMLAKAINAGALVPGNTVVVTIEDGRVTDIRKP